MKSPLTVKVVDGAVTAVADVIVKLLLTSVVFDPKLQDPEALSNVRL